MRQIRRNVFETNSSSTHSISFTRHRTHTLEEDKLNDCLYADDDNYVHVSLGEFGWGYDDYCDALTKLSYLITMICETNGIDIYDWSNSYSDAKVRSELEECDDFIELNDLIIKKTGSNGIYVEGSGYVDHQSVCDIKYLLSDYNLTAEEFIFDPTVKLIIDNDNH